MEVDSVSSVSTTINSVTAPNSLGKDAFLKILVAQLSHQDPLSTQDNSQYISQMAQFSALEQSQNMNTSLEKMLVSQQLTEGSLMIGKEVAFSVGDDKYVQELVKGVIIEEGKVYLKTENGVYNIDNVIGVGDFENDEQSGTANEGTGSGTQSSTDSNAQPSTN